MADTDRHRRQQCPAFVRQVADARPRRRPQVVVDNLATHKHPTVRAWRLSRSSPGRPAPWSRPTVADLIAAIERFITAWNDRCRAFI